jgi:hypothetical protein
MGWTGHVAQNGEQRNAYRLLVGKPEGKWWPLGKPRHGLEIILIRILERYNQVWTDLAQDRSRWWSSQSKSYIMTESQSASPSWYEAPIWDPWPIFPILSLIILFFDSLGFVDVRRPLWREDGVCIFQFLLGITSAAFLRSESHGTHEQFIVSIFETPPQPRGPGSCIYFPQEQDSR